MSIQAISACGKIVETATRTCDVSPASTMVPQSPAQPNWDALANSFASLSAAFAWGSIVLGLIAVLAAIAWGKIVTMIAEKEAREEAKRCANTYIRKWLVEEAPGIIQRHLELLNDATMGSGSDSQAADQIGESA